ncbi:MAG: response regulator [Acidobacteriia bacterium]|jgi:DNA-binding NtrC family response regulator|nr:response regulator [Terriglobia bacterium]
MVEMTWALLVCDGNQVFEPLKLILHNQCITTRVAKSCGEALLLLWGKQPPHLVFTDVHLTDGNWTDVLSLADKSSLPINVIVVSRLMDVKLYIDAMQRGAFDFISPPFEGPDVAHVVRCATQNILRRRLALVKSTDSKPIPAARTEWQQAVISGLTAISSPADPDP